MTTCGMLAAVQVAQLLSPILLLTGLKVEQLRWSRPKRYLYAISLNQPVPGNVNYYLLISTYLNYCRSSLWLLSKYAHHLAYSTRSGLETQAMWNH